MLLRLLEELLSNKFHLRIDFVYFFELQLSKFSELLHVWVYAFFEFELIFWCYFVIIVIDVLFGVLIDEALCDFGIMELQTSFVG